MGEIERALLEMTNAVTQANAFPPLSVGMTGGQIEQLRTELRANAHQGHWRDDGMQVTLYFPSGPLRVFEEQ